MLYTPGNHSTSPWSNVSLDRGSESLWNAACLGVGGDFSSAICSMACRGQGTAVVVLCMSLKVPLMLGVLKLELLQHLQRRELVASNVSLGP